MKRYVTIILAVIISVLLCGCDMWMDGSYHSVKPHQEAGDTQNQESVEASSYNQLYQALCNMVSAGREESVIYASGIESDQLETYTSIAVNSVTSSDAIGAYAVDTISYEVGTNVGRTAIAFKISYNHSRSEILRIKRTATMEEACNEIAQALQTCEPGVVVLVEAYKDTDFVQFVQDYMDLNPDVCMEMPQVSATVYPDSGSQRVIELSFTYQTSRETLRTMQAYVEPVFRAANLNVSAEEGEVTKFSRMYAFLMERSDYQLETSITPSYSLLRHGVGDSKAFAVVYAAMCRDAGLDCQTVTGTRDGEPWTWNLVCIDGVFYYVDLLRSVNMERLQLLSDAEMRGYVWDYTAYPETGPAYYSEEVTPSQEETVPPETETVPEETGEPPTETEAME